MDKNKVVWLIVRLTGVYLAYQGILSFFAFCSSFFSALQQPEIFQTSFVFFIGTVTLTAFYGVVAHYLLRDGRLFFDLLNLEEPPNKTENDLAETALNLDEEQTR